eukprot:m.37299 g.37299  ORF g.37299 m.37299 type:complete len:55 (+) comp32352_c0_seq6:14-178(+)
MKLVCSTLVQLLCQSYLFLCLGDIELPPKVKDAMQMQVAAERRKRAQVLTSEGT